MMSLIIILFLFSLFVEGQTLDSWILPISLCILLPVSSSHILESSHSQVHMLSCISVPLHTWVSQLELKFFSWFIRNIIHPLRLRLHIPSFLKPALLPIPTSRLLTESSCVQWDLSPLWCPISAVTVTTWHQTRHSSVWQTCPACSWLCGILCASHSPCLHSLHYRILSKSVLWWGIAPASLLRVSPCVCCHHFVVLSQCCLDSGTSVRK